MRLKAGVSLKGIRNELLIGLLVADRVYEAHGIDMVITAGSDGRHSPGSLHYLGLAADIRTNNVLPGQLESILIGLKDALGGEHSEFDVVNENDHLHIEYQPKH